MLGRTSLCLYLVFVIIALTCEIDAQETTSKTIPEKYDQASVMCRTLGVEVIQNRKEKKCGEITWHTSKGDNPSATEVFYWRDIIITAYDDNKTVRFTFDDLRAGWELAKIGYGYLITVYLLDVNFASLITGGIEIFPPPGSFSGYRPPLCNIPEPNSWRNKEYEYKLKGSDKFKYDDIAHMVFTLRTWNGGVGFRRC